MTVLATDPSVRTAYETDASGVHLLPDFVARPTDPDDIIALVRDANASNTPITCAGGQTSTTGASISDTGILLSLRGMDRILDCDPGTRTIRVQPGAILADVKRTAAAEGLLFAPDPTSEEECTVGGAIACNASGARTYKYGAIRNYVRSMRVVLGTGEVVTLYRTQLEKNTVGYSFVHDPIDWFIGSEGTLGVILDAELSLLPLPDHVTGFAFLFPSETAALAFIVAARESHDVSPRCLEYFDAEACRIACGANPQMMPSGSETTMVYTEQEHADTDDLETILGNWLAIAEAHGAGDDIHVFSSEAELKTARMMRHAVPATMNERGAQQRANGGRKVSTDWAVPYRQLAETITTARELATMHDILSPVIYGHAGNGHPHQNFVARSADELAIIEGIVGETLKSVIGRGGTVAAEHGIGKVKRKWVPLQLSPWQIGAMRAVKYELDPKGILAPGNIL